MISSGDTILLAGDSWICGEWGAGDGKCTHLGLEQFLIDYGCKVLNLGRGGYSNKDSVNSIVKNLPLITPNKIFWVQTDPIRDLRPYSIENFPKSINELKKRQVTLIKKTYEELNCLNTPIHCMGGTTKLFPIIKEYTNLIPLIDSIIEFFHGTMPQIWISDWINSNYLNFSETFLEELSSAPNYILPKEWFYPDGVHPNQHAHKKIFEYILNKKQTC